MSSRGTHTSSLYLTKPEPLASFRRPSNHFSFCILHTVTVTCCWHVTLVFYYLPHLLTVSVHHHRDGRRRGWMLEKPRPGNGTSKCGGEHPGFLLENRWGLGTRGRRPLQGREGPGPRGQSELKGRRSGNGTRGQSQWNSRGPGRETWRMVSSRTVDKVGCSAGGSNVALCLREKRVSSHHTKLEFTGNGQVAVCWKLNISLSGQ